MNKRKICIIIGIVLIVLGVILIQKKQTKDSSEHIGLNQSEEYVYKTIKTKDFDAKVVLSFPVYKNMSEDALSDYYKTYSLNDSTITATEIPKETLPMIEAQSEKMKSLSIVSNYNEEKINVKNDYISSDDITAKIVNYDANYGENTIHSCSLNVLVKISNTDYIQVVYNNTKDEITKDAAIDLIKNFRITAGAEYKAGTIDINELVIELEKTTLVHIKYKAKIALDSNQYEEKEDASNSKEHTRVTNLVTNEQVELYLFYRAEKLGIKLIDSLKIDLKNNSRYESLSDFKETKIYDTKVYEASTNENTINALMIDDEVCLVIIYPKNYEYIEDFNGFIFEVE